MLRIRLNVDLDERFQPICTGYEVHEDDELTSFGTGPLPGPFDLPSEAFDLVRLHVLDHVGQQLSLFT